MSFGAGPGPCPFGREGAEEPALSERIGAAVRLHGCNGCTAATAVRLQRRYGRRHLNPGAYVGALADAVREQAGSCWAGWRSITWGLGTEAAALLTGSKGAQSENPAERTLL